MVFINVFLNSSISLNNRSFYNYVIRFYYSISSKSYLFDLQVKFNYDKIFCFEEFFLDFFVVLENECNVLEKWCFRNFYCQ